MLNSLLKKYFFFYIYNATNAVICFNTRVIFKNISLQMAVKTVSTHEEAFGVGFNRYYVRSYVISSIHCHHFYVIG